MAVGRYSTPSAGGTKFPTYPVLPTPATATGTNPAPRPGQGAFGLVPGSVALPDPAADLGALYPNLTGTNAQASSNIMSELQGQLSPETINALKDQAANFGVSSGMPGSGLTNNSGLRNLGLETQKVQSQGLQDYLAAISGIKNTQTVSPETQVGVATQNSVWNSAPDPAAAAQLQQQQFDKYLESLKNPAAGSVNAPRPNQNLYDAGWSTNEINAGRKNLYSHP